MWSSPSPLQRLLHFVLHSIDQIVKMNPYTQAGWGEFGSLTSTWGIPPTFGALPYAAPTSSAPLFPTAKSSDASGTGRLTYYFTNFAPDITNCSVFGPQSQKCFSIISMNPAYTTVQNAERNSIAIIEWLTHPTVEVRDLLPKQAVSHWLPLSTNQKSAFFTSCWPSVLTNVLVSDIWK